MEAIKIYEEMDLIGHVGRVGPHLQKRLQEYADHPLVGDVRGVGMIAGIELVKDKKTREAFDPEVNIARKVGDHGEEHGVLMRIIGDRVVFSPPLIMTETEVDELMDGLGKALDDTWAEVR